MLNIIKQEINLTQVLRKKIDFAINYANVKVSLEYGHLIRLEPTNLAYVEPHKIIINKTIFLFFNDINHFYVNDLNNSFNFNLLQTKFIEAKNN